MSLTVWLWLLLAGLIYCLYSSIYWNRKGVLGLAIVSGLCVPAFAYAVGDVVSRLGWW